MEALIQIIAAALVACVFLGFLAVAGIVFAAGLIAHVVLRVVDAIAGHLE